MRLRPRFSKTLSLSEKEVDKHILNKVNCYNSKLKIEDNGSLKIVKFPKEQQKLWTPQMEITLELLEEGIKVRGSVGPNSKVWLVFSFLYFGFGLAFLASLFYGLSQYVLHHSYIVALSISALCLVLFAALYLVSYIGQYKSKNEIEVLSHCFLSTIED
jgi:hypothetical protein